MNFIDTADVYSGGESEEIVGKALKGRRDEVVLATKFVAPDERGLEPARLVAPLDHARGREQPAPARHRLHRPLPGPPPRSATDIDDTLGALTDLVHQGKIRVLGSSTYPAEQIVEAQWVAERRGRERFRCEQPPYSIFARRIETSVLPTCQRYGMGVIPWSPLAGGWLTGRYRRSAPPTGRPGRAACPPASTTPAREPAEARPRRDAAELAETRGCRSRTCPWRSCSNTPRSRRRSSAPAPWSSSPTCSRRRRPALRRVLDQIDELVPPGTNLNLADTGWEPASLRRSQRRRPRRPQRPNGGK